MAIVDLLNNTNVMHGEVLAYDVNITGTTAANGTVGCTIVTLRFTEFTSTLTYYFVGVGAAVLEHFREIHHKNLS